MKTITEAATTCFHCGDDCKKSRIQIGDKTFCCNGCKTVYQVLHQHQLDNYYCLNEAPGKTVQEFSSSRFVFLDDESIARTIISFSSPAQNQVTFYLPQIHCSSCLWLLENLSTLNSAIISSRVNFSSKTVHLAYHPGQLTLRQLAELLASLGYEPHISLQDTETKPKKYSPRKAAYKLGITGFCFANIMLISFPEYLGLEMGKDSLLTHFFRYINLGLALPVVIYGASEFFINAWHSFRQRYINIDAPIALAIAITFGRSLYEILTGSGSGYLDSMSGIVFFMLIGRTLQNRTYSTLEFNRDYKAYLPIAVTVLSGNEKHIRKVQEICKDDVLMLHHQELIPVDSMLSKGKAVIDYSFITGETADTTVQTGELLYAGGRVKGMSIEAVTVKPFSQSSFTQLWNNKAFSKEEDGNAAFSTTISKYFSLILFVIAAAAFVFWQFHHPANAWNALTAVLIVACPCSLLLSTTFTYGFIIDILSRHHLFVKNAHAVETLAKTTHIVFDKTGTLTEASQLPLTVLQQSWSPEEKSIALSLMAHSIHPFSRAIVKHFGRFNKVRTDNFKEIEGMGIEAFAADHHVRIGSNLFVTGNASVAGGSEVLVWFDGVVKAHFIIENKIKLGVAEMLSALKHFRLSLLSGDTEKNRSQMEALMPTGTTLLFRQSPQQKLDYICHLQERNEHVLMVGDGLNDAGALKQSNTGIAVAENTFSFSPACDAVMEARYIKHLGNYIRIARKAKQLVITGFIYSILYNIFGLYFATTAQLNPMVAAILMPLSSIGIVGITYFGSKYISAPLNNEHD